jgi:hypothetical protein
LPYEVVKDEEACSASKPWAVRKKGGSKVYGCHESKADAEKQQAALYANETSAAAQGAEIEYQHMKVISLATEGTVQPLNAPILTFEGNGIALATVQDVPLLKIGMKYPASTGAVDFSFQHLSSAVSASADPMLPRPRVKLGHTDPRYNDAVCPACSASVKFDFDHAGLFDAYPSFGFVENCRLTNDGGQITADLIDVPLWLASVMPVAFSNRSIEGWFGHEGPNQKQYEFALTAVALLGVMFPACLDLADLPKMYGSQMPEFVKIQEEAA